MRIVVVETTLEFDARAAATVRDALRQRPEAAIGLPTGDTPLGMYAALARERSPALELARWFAIDELHGIARDHAATNASYFHTHAPQLSIRLLNSEAEDIDAECTRFVREIDAVGGLDLAVLGIGANGHIAFNEPGSAFDSRARRVTLAEATRRVYAPQFASLDEVPAHGLTLGIADLLAARRVILLARGEEKSAIVAAAIEGPVTEGVPASALQRHDDVTVLLDENAGTQLTRR